MRLALIVIVGELTREQYFENFAKKYDLYPYIKLNSRLTSATWDEAKGIYNVKVNVEGKEIDDWCHVLGEKSSRKQIRCLILIQRSQSMARDS